MKNRQVFEKMEANARAAAARQGADGDIAVRTMFDSSVIAHRAIDVAIEAAAELNIGDQTILNALIQKSMNRLFRIDGHAATDLLQCIVGLYRAKANGQPTGSGPEWEAFNAAGARLVKLAAAQSDGDAA